MMVVLVVLPQASVRGQGIQLNLDQQVQAFDTESPTTIGQLIDFAQRFGIPMGIEWVDQASAKPPLRIHARNTTARLILQGIVQENPDYSVNLTGEVVHVFSSAVISDARNFLNLAIPNFQVKHENLYGAEFFLRMNIAEVINPRLGGYAGGHGYGINAGDTFAVRNLDLSLQNTSVRQILNVIVARQGNAMWLVRVKPPRLMVNGRFYVQAASATSEEVAPDFHWQFIPLRQIK